MKNGRGEVPVVDGSAWVVLGAGFTGSRLARWLGDHGARVRVTRRHPGDAQDVARATGAEAAICDLSDPDSVAAILRPGDRVVDSVPPQADSPAIEEELVRRCAASGVARLIYLGSTGVYPHGDDAGGGGVAGAGGEVDETCPPAPIGGRGQRRLAAETAILEAAAASQLSAVALRIAGIYGPGRGVHARLLRGDYRIIGAGESVVSRVHVDDLVSAIVHVGMAPTLAHQVFNVADDHPTPSAEMGDAVADLLGVPRPPRVDPSEVSADVRAMLGAARRIRNQRLKDLGWSLRYPSWQEGIAACLREEGQSPSGEP